jgi:hypothetical protein
MSLGEVMFMISALSFAYTQASASMKTVMAKYFIVKISLFFLFQNLHLDFTSDFIIDSKTNFLNISNYLIKFLSQLSLSYHFLAKIDHLGFIDLMITNIT